MKNTLNVVRFGLNLCTCSLLAGLLSISGCVQPDRNESAPAAPSVAASASIAPVALSPASSAGHTTGGPVKKFYIGNWEPVSNVWQGMGNLRVDRQGGFRWHQCNTTYVEERAIPPGSGAMLVLSPDSNCRLDDMLHTRVLFVRVANQLSPCDVRVAVYASDADMHDDRPSAEGIYSRRQCGPTP